MAREEGFFDDLARGLADGTLTRGKALRLMGAAVVGGALGSLGIGEASATPRCKPTGKKCRNDAQCCSGNCSGGTCQAQTTTTTPLPVPGRQVCTCQENLLRIELCAPEGCESGFNICDSYCSAFGGVVADACIPDDPSAC